jgi:hypothetical protein
MWRSITRRCITSRWATAGPTCTTQTDAEGIARGAGFRDPPQLSLPRLSFLSRFAVLVASVKRTTAFHVSASRSRKLPAIVDTVHVSAEKRTFNWAFERHRCGGGAMSPVSCWRRGRDSSPISFRPQFAALSCARDGACAEREDRSRRQRTLAGARRRAWTLAGPGGGAQRRLLTRKLAGLLTCRLASLIAC